MLSKRSCNNFRYSDTIDIINFMKVIRNRRFAFRVLVSRLKYYFPLFFFPPYRIYFTAALRPEFKL